MRPSPAGSRPRATPGAASLCTVAAFTAAAALTLAGCDPVIPQDPPPPDFIVAEFDPAAEDPVVPLPNDLALSPETGLVSLDDGEDDTPTERAFNRYLRTLDGFPTTATAMATFTGALDPASVTPGSVRVIDVTDPSAPAPLVDGVAATWNAEKARLEVRGPWARARRYAIALVGGEDGLRGADGRRVIGSPAFALLRAKNPLVRCGDAADPACGPTTTLIEGETEEETRAVAHRLEQARRALKPALDWLEAEGIPRDRLAGAWTFSTVRQPLATFDPANGIVPFPNELLMDGDQVNLPISPDDDPQTVLLKERLNTLDGFSTTAALLTELGDETGAADVRIDASTLAASQFLLVNLGDPTESMDLEVVCRSCGDGMNPPGEEADQIALRPTRPLRPQTQYAVYWLRGARALGEDRLVNTGPVFALIRLAEPLVVDGKSQLDSVDDLTAGQLEPLRGGFQILFDVTDARGIPREDVLLAWTFRTQTVVGPLVDAARLPETWRFPTSLVGGPGALTDVDLTPLSFLSTVAGEDFHSHLRWAKEGTFLAGSVLDPDALDTLPDGTLVPTEGAWTQARMASPGREVLHFFLAVPKVARNADGSIPIIVFQHGLGRSRRDAALIANTAARHGYATLSIDAPLHGDRSFCYSDDPCRPGTTCVDHRCAGGYRFGELQPGIPDPLQTPLISGSGFISTANPLYTRDHIRQHVLDLAQLLRVLRDDAEGLGAVFVDDPETPLVEKLATREVYFVGQSLGGIIGGLATAVLPELTAVTLNVPGASPTDVILRAPAFAAQKAAFDASLEARGIIPGSQRYEFFLDLARWILDPADPQNFGRHYIHEPLRSLPKKRVFISWMEGDEVVPNENTQLLIRSVLFDEADAGLFSQKRYTCGRHAFLLDITAPTLALTAQEDAIAWFGE